MNKSFNTTPHRAGKTISSSPTVHRVPTTGDRKPAANRPAPLTGRHGRCASCGGRK